MGFKIRKSISLGKGVCVNLGKKGVSASVRIGNATVSSKGRVTARLAPGVSYTTDIKKTKKEGRRHESSHGRQSTLGTVHELPPRTRVGAGAKGEFRRCIDRLSGVAAFTVGTKMVSGDLPVSGSRRYADCSVESSPQPKGRKPHMVVRNGKGEIVFEVGAQARSAYAVLSEVAGWKLDWISWKEEPSYSGSGTFLRCRIKEPARVVAPDGPPITRIVLDTETTGLHPETDEILQLSIIDGNGGTLHNQLYRPSTVERWSDAQKIHGITPAMVAECGSIEDDRGKIQSILDRAQEICAYNADFDLAFLGRLRLRLDTSKVTDTMKEYGRRYHSTAYYKLEKAASECGYRYHAHDALEDCQATLAVQSKLDGQSSPWLTAKNRHTARPAMSEEDRRRMEAVAEAARRYDAARQDGPSARAGQTSEPARGSAPEGAPVSRFRYWTCVTLTFLLGLLSALVALSCLAAPVMLVLAVPGVLCTIRAVKACGRMRRRVTSKRRRH